MLNTNMAAMRIQTRGDVDDGGGMIVSIPQSTVFINNKLVAVENSHGSGHPPCPLIVSHCVNQWSTHTNQTALYVENKAVILENDVDSCTHVRINGSSDTFS